MKIQSDIVDSQALLKPADLAADALHRSAPDALPADGEAAAALQPPLSEPAARAAELDAGEAVLRLNPWSQQPAGERILLTGQAADPVGSTPLDAAAIERSVRHILEPLL